MTVSLLESASTNAEQASLISAKTVGPSSDAIIP